MTCSLCSETMEREIIAIHKGENCPQRIVTCDFCEFPLPAIDLAEHQVKAISYFEIRMLVQTRVHTLVLFECDIFVFQLQEVCGNRTELCHLCNRYIRLHERYNHEATCGGISDNGAGSSRYVFNIFMRQFVSITHNFVSPNIIPPIPFSFIGIQRDLFIDR